MAIKKGDKVTVLAGKDKGTSGKVVRVLPRRDMLVVEGVNVAKKHQRARKQNEHGQILDKAMPVHVSNVRKIKKR